MNNDTSSYIGYEVHEYAERMWLGSLIEWLKSETNNRLNFNYNKYVMHVIERLQQDYYYFN